MQSPDDGNKNIRTHTHTQPQSNEGTHTHKERNASSLTCRRMPAVLIPTDPRNMPSCQQPSTLLHAGCTTAGDGALHNTQPLPAAFSLLLTRTSSYVFFHMPVILCWFSSCKVHSHMHSSDSCTAQRILCIQHSPTAGHCPMTTMEAASIWPHRYCWLVAALHEVIKVSDPASSHLLCFHVAKMHEAHHQPKQSIKPRLAKE